VEREALECGGLPPLFARVGTSRSAKAAASRRTPHEKSPSSSKFSFIFTEDEDENEDD